MSKVYIYVVDRDFGFAPNPFHGCCTLATCKPNIRQTATIGDWVIGVGGGRLNATGRCVFAMLVTEILTFDEYWKSPIYLDKKPVRNGSKKMMVGDNIYHHEATVNQWQQEDSHHSNEDGTTNLHNLITDTQSDKVLISKHFFYFGSSSPHLPMELLNELGFANRRGYRVFEAHRCITLIEWLHSTFPHSLNLVDADPFDFDKSEKRYSSGNGKIT